jgi:hypothetical protein
MKKWKKEAPVDRCACSNAEVDGAKEKVGGQNREEPKAE